MGPTACGKSQFAIHLRSYLPIEIINVDSALIYRDMNIGTSKPNVSDLLKHPHRLLNIKDPLEHYSVAEFQKDVLKEILDIIKDDKIPCLVGGTMFYYHTLLYGLSVLPPSNLKIREYLLSTIHHKKDLHKQLELIDPISALRIHKNDIQRLIRALEIFYISGKTLTELTQHNNYQLPYTVLQFCLMPPNQEWLHKKIELRFHQMLYEGFQKEVEKLFLRGDLHIDLQSMRCIGYRQMWEYLEYKISYQNMLYKIINATKKLAKHQLTWLKKWKNIHILYCQNYSFLVKKVLDIFNKIKN